MIEPVRIRTRPVPPPAPVRVRTRTPARARHIAPHALPRLSTPEWACHLGIPDNGPPEKWAGWPNGSASFKNGKPKPYYAGRIMAVEGGGYMVLRWSPSKRIHTYAGTAGDLTKAFMLL